MIYIKEDINNKNKIDILPMIDIIFAILSFLIISSLYLTRVDTISVDLPKASNSIKQNNNSVYISIDKAGNLFINNEVIQLEELKVKIIKLIDESRNPIVLNADRDISYGYLINVLDVLRSIDGLKIALSIKSLE